MRLQKKRKAAESERSQAEQWKKRIIEYCAIVSQGRQSACVCVIQLEKQGTHRAMPTVIDFRP